MKKKISKILTVFMVMAVILSTLQLSAFASEKNADATATPAANATGAATPDAKAKDAAVTPAAYGVEVALYLMESNDDWSFGDQAPKDWSEPKSESIFIKEDGTYTFSLKDLNIPSDKFMLCYLKDVAKYPKDSKVTHSNVPDDLMIITDVFKVNDNTKEVNDKVRTGLKKGIFDIAYHNNWDVNDDCVNFDTTVNSVEVTITVTGITGEPGAIKYEPTKAAAAPTVAAAETANNTTDTATTEDNKSGNSLPIIISIAAAIIIAVIIIIIVRKKK